LRATRLLAAALLLVVGALTTHSSAQQPASARTAKILADVNAFYGGVQTFSADFEQIYIDKAAGKTTTAKGHVTAAGARSNWVLSSPPGCRAVSDGKTFSFYDGASNMWAQQPASESQYSAALAFLASATLPQLLNFVSMNGADLEFPNGWVLVGEPRQPTLTYTKLLLYVDKASSEVMRVLVLDAQGNRNRFSFTHSRLNASVPQSQFQFVPPPGATVWGSSATAPAAPPAPAPSPPH